MGAFLGRREWTVPLGITAVLLAAAGWAALLLANTAFSLEHFFPQGPLRWLFWATTASLAGALLLTVIDSSRIARRRTHVVFYDGSRSAARQPAIEDFRKLSAQLLQDADPDFGRLVDEALRTAMSVGASDIHLTPGSKDATLTFRVDGSLCEVGRFTPRAANRVVQRAKVLAGLELSQLRPQDGGLERSLGAFTVRARVSVLPVQHGQRLVLRLVRGSDAATPLDDLGLSAPMKRDLLEILHRNQGVFYVSGPVGSGKTTTLYAALGEIHRIRGETTSLVSLEDPIEHELSFVSQTQINSKAGLGFAPALRTVLRQDPGALMIGEVRDRETAEIATQAGLTGHLILTTLHVDSAPSTFARLIDMGLSSVLVADSCAGSMAQRLVRRLCVHCKQEARVAPAELQRLQALGIETPPLALFAPTGCDHCEGRGYSGRLLVAELLRMSPGLRQLVGSGAPTSEVHARAIGEGMVPLVRSALDLAILGETSLAEVLRVST